MARRERLTILLTKEEKEALESIAHLEEKTVSEYVRERVFSNDKVDLKITKWLKKMDEILDKKLGLKDV